MKTDYILLFQYLLSVKVPLIMIKHSALRDLFAWHICQYFSTDMYQQMVAWKSAEKYWKCSQAMH